MTNESQDLVRQHVQKTDMRFPVAIVPSEQEYSVKGYPTAFLVDRVELAGEAKRAFASASCWVIAFTPAFDVL